MADGSLQDLLDEDQRNDREPRPPTSSERYPDRARSVWGCVKIFLLSVALVVIALVGLFAYAFKDGWTKGRPLRGRGWRRRPPPRTTGKRAARDHWEQMAQEEHESVAAFGELALDLMAAGAPMSLVTRCQQAALEEARHTTLCLERAASLQDDTSRPPCTTVSKALRRARTRPRWRTALLTRLAIESYVDGCLGEASSARVLGKLAADVDDPAMRDALRTLAREELGHAELSRDVVTWCVGEGGDVVRTAVALVRRRKRPRGIASGTNPALRRLGVPDERLRAEALVWAAARYG